MSSFQKTAVRSLLLALLTLVATAALAQDCDCIWQGAFIQAQQRADVVLLGTVSDSRGNSFDVAVDEVLRGQHFLDEARIWGLYPDTCRPPTSQFEAGSRWLLALQRIEEVPAGGFDIDTPNLSYGRVGDYALSRCGVFWLPVRDELVHGNLAEATRWEYEGTPMEPVTINLVRRWLQGEIEVDRIITAARVNPELRQLRRATQRFLHEQAPPLQLTPETE